jgi:hypothetical protein
MHKNNGDKRNRTDDLMLAKHPLYQLSYVPKKRPEADSNRRIEDLQSSCTTSVPSSQKLNLERVKISESEAEGAEGRVVCAI